MEVGKLQQATRDTLLAGQLVLWQPARGNGYRFNLDPVLLYGFTSSAAHVLDLGAGCGVLGLLMLASGKAERVTAVEIQGELCELALKSARENGLESCFEVLCGDLRHLELPHVDAVVFNPPYFRAGEGKASPDLGRSAARHERFGTLADFVARAFSCVQATGPVSAIIPVARKQELEALFADQEARVARRREVRPRAGAPVAHVLCEARRLTAIDEPCVEEPPLFVHAGTGREFTADVRAWLRQ